MVRGLQAAAVVVVALIVIGSCTHTDKPDATSAAGPSSATPTAASRTARPTTAARPPTTAPAHPPTTTPPQPPLDVIPITYTGTAGGPMPPVPPVPRPGTPVATLEVRGGWTGSFHLDGNDRRVGISCNAQPEPRAGIEVAALNYLATSKAGTGPYGLPNGGWYLRVTRTGRIDDPAGIEVDVTAVDTRGELVEIAGFGTEAAPAIAAAGPADNSSVAFSFVGAVVPMNPALHEKVAAVSVTGTVVCPGPLPQLTVLRGDG